MKTANGFTLLEVLIYLSLLGVIFGGAITAVFGMVASSNRTQARIALLDEGDFILAKLDWALSDAASINVSNNILSVNKFSPAYNPIVFDSSLNFSTAGAPAQSLAADNIKVQNVAFYNIAATATTTEGVQISFTLFLLQADRPASQQDFGVTKYLKK